MNSTDAMFSLQGRLRTDLSLNKSTTLAGVYFTRRSIHAICITTDGIRLWIVSGSATKIAVPDEQSTDFEAFLRLNDVMKPRLMDYLAEFNATGVALCDFAGDIDSVSYPTYRVRELVRMLDDDVYELVAQRDARSAAARHEGLVGHLSTPARLAAGAALAIAEKFGMSFDVFDQ
jgi:hypothetical protein